VKVSPPAGSAGKMPVPGKGWKIVKRARKPADAREEIEVPDQPSSLLM